MRAANSCLASGVHRWCSAGRGAEFRFPAAGWKYRNFARFLPALRLEQYVYFLVFDSFKLMNMTTPPDFIDKLWREAVAEGVQPLDRFPQSGWKDLTMNFCVFIPEDPARLSTDSPRILRKEYPELSYWAFLRLEASHQGFCPCAQDIQMATMNFFGKPT